MGDVIKIAGGTFEAEGHVYRDESGKEVPSVTGVLDSVGMVDYSKIPRDVLENKRKIGDAAHFAIRLLEENDLNWSTVQESWAGYLTAYLNFKDDMEWEPEASEQSGIVTVHGMPMAYTWDGFGRMKGIKYRCLLEYKCTTEEQPSWKYQLAGYEMSPLPSREKGEYVARIAVRFGPDGSYKPYLYENPRDRDKFLWMLGTVYTKIEEGVKWKKESL